MLRTGKATRGQVRQHNRQLILRSVYGGMASNRAALAAQTGLTKPAVSDLVESLIADGLLVEEGLGVSSGGKRPRLLRFIPDARQVIGVAIDADAIRAVLVNLDGTVIAEHVAALTPHMQDVLPVAQGVVNGLLAQSHAPLLCIGIGTSAAAPRPLDTPLRDVYGVPVHTADSAALAALAQVVFGSIDTDIPHALVTVSDSVGVGAVINGELHTLGGDIGHLSDARGETLRLLLGWNGVSGRTRTLADTLDGDVGYLRLRFAAAYADPAALALCDTLAAELAHVFAWVIALIQPRSLALGGRIADLGDPFLERVLDAARHRLSVEPVGSITFHVDDTPNLTALGAAARALHIELGLL